MSRRPRASGYFRTGYAQDLKLVETRTERWSLAAFVVALLAFPFFASPFQLDLANQVFLASIGALALMLLTGYAGQISLGHAGLLAAGAFTAGILFKETARAVLGDAAGGRSRRRAARRRVRPAVAAAARAVSRGQHAGAAFPRRLSGRRVREPSAASRPASSSIRRRLAAGPSPAGAPGISSSARSRRRRCSSASTCCAAAPGAPGRRSAPTRRWRRRSASALPRTSCSRSSSARR